ncbi:DUF1328 family protein [Haloarcula sp. JP-L23]|nr:DUF1328 domain-containing protein [Haloarcula sp. JP-L23]
MRSNVDVVGLGARGVAGVSMDIAKWLVIIFVVLAIVTFIL